MDSFVSIIIPCRNEEKFIEICLKSILNQDYPKENLEVLVVDGASGDKTREIIKEFSNKNLGLKIKVLDNEKKFTNFALNLGIKESEGEIIIFMGAHARYEKDYVSKCVKYLDEYNADNVGGVVKTLPAEDTIQAKAIAIVLSHPFGVGGAVFRKGAQKPVETDTVFGGCYKREIFEKIGYFNENLFRSQDLEFNMRLKKFGGKIILVPDIIVYYYPHPVNFKEFFIYHLKDGVWATYPLKFIKTPYKLRHHIPLIFVLTLPLSIWLYAFLSLLISFNVAVKEREASLFFLLPAAFFCRHFGYGIGSLIGLFKILKK
jgi:glycosyltransferase involved in cell wall biosynthesis